MRSSSPRYSSLKIFQTVTISGQAGRQAAHLELGDVTVGGFLSGKNPLMTLDFANTGHWLSTPVLSRSMGLFRQAPLRTQTITDVAWGDAFVFTGADFTGDTVTFDPATNDLTVKNGGTTVFTMDDVSLQSGFAGGFESSMGTQSRPSATRAAR